MTRLEPAPLTGSPSLPAMPALTTDRRLSVAVSLGLGLAAGLLTSFLAPRGPTTTLNALMLMAVALAVGVVAGARARTRWVLVPLFVVYAIGVEAGRLDVAGPTLDIRLDLVYGVIAFVLTRVLHAVLAALPMAFGVLAGIALARRLDNAPVAGQRRPIGSALLGVAVAALAILVAWPASTPPVLGPDGSPVEGSIAELSTVRLGGQEHTIMIRAADPTDPVLLYLSGGPGQSDLALSRALTSGWVEDFVVVDLDQRGNGKSYPAIDPVSAMTVDRAVADVIELTQQLADRFDEDRIYLMGESWGTLLGVLAVEQRPDLFHAWIGSGQMVNVLETDKRIYEDLVAYAERVGDRDLATTLADAGAPPYRDFPWTNTNLLAWYDLIYKPYTPSDGYIARGEAAGLDPFGALGSEYSFIEKANVLRGLLDTFGILYPQLYALDLREAAPRLEVPVYVLDGAAELDGRRALALQWFDQVEAPTKQLITYENAAHSVAFEQADEVQRLLNEVIVPATYGE